MADLKREAHAIAPAVSAEKREEAVELLSAAFANDAITVDDFERRVADVYKADSAKALQAILADLPAPEAKPANVPALADQPSTIARRSDQRFNSVLSTIERRIQGPVPERLDLRSVMGSLELDLRRAEFPPGVTEIRVRAIMGSIEVELPDHVRVEDEGHAFLGMFSVRGRSRHRERDDAPVVRITGESIMGSVEVEVDD